MTRDTTTRRNVLKAAPAAAVAAALPALASAEPESELRRALLQWIADYRSLNTDYAGVPEEVFNGMVDRSSERLREIMAAPAESPRDLALKVVAQSISDYLDFEETTIAELRRLAELDEAVLPAALPAAPIS